MIDKFWRDIDTALDTIEAQKPGTFAGVKAILDTLSEGDWGADAFFPGSGGDRQLMGSLRAAGWHVFWAQASYFYVAVHAETGETLTYIEGDVFAGDTR